MVTYFRASGGGGGGCCWWYEMAESSMVRCHIYVCLCRQGETLDPLFFLCRAKGSSRFLCKKKKTPQQYQLCCALACFFLKSRAGPELHISSGNPYISKRVSTTQPTPPNHHAKHHAESRIAYVLASALALPEQMIS
jgi:hypothetical protein